MREQGSSLIERHDAGLIAPVRFRGHAADVGVVRRPCGVTATYDAAARVHQIRGLVNDVQDGCAGAQIGAVGHAIDILVSQPVAQGRAGRRGRQDESEQGAEHGQAHATDWCRCHTSFLPHCCPRGGAAKLSDRIDRLATGVPGGIPKEFGWAAEKVSRL